MWGLLAAAVTALDLACAMAVFVVFAKPDFIVGWLAWGWPPSRWDDCEPLDDDEVDLLRGALRRLRWLALAALAALAFASGACLMWIRLQ